LIQNNNRYHLIAAGGPDGIEALSLGLIFLQCFDTVG